MDKKHCASYDKLVVDFSADAVGGTFTSGVVTANGDNAANTIDFSRDAAGTILLNGAAVPGASVANTTLLQAFGNGGNDVITVNETNGALPAANLFGGAGNDTITGGSGADLLFGQAGNDTLLGKGGNDQLFGGEGNDVLTGGDGDDGMFGEAGDDRMIWNPGDDTDLMEGGTGTDTAEVQGGNGNEVFTATANGARVRFDRLDPAPFALDIGTTENLVVNMNGGDDSFSATGNLAALIKVTVDGGAGNDTILGSNGDDTLIGGDGQDFIDGQQGSDVARLGAGDDTFQWDPGDGSDIVEGGGGFDTMLFNGSAGAEIMDLAAVGGRMRMTRNLGNIVMDTNDLERVDIRALGGNDTITVNNLSGTETQEVNIDLGVNNAGDLAADTVIATGRNSAETIEVLGTGTSVGVIGLAAQVLVNNSEAGDSLVVNGAGGNDLMDASTLVAGITKLTLDGGTGNDRILGSRGADTLIGGDGNDAIDGQQGDDLALMGAGNDTFTWDPGDGSDTIEGGEGTDTMVFNGAGAAENMEMGADATGRAILFRDVGNITMTTNDLEVVKINAAGGTDAIRIGDLSTTEVKRVEVDLAGDGAVDQVFTTGSSADENIKIATSGSQIRVTGTPVELRLAGADANGTDKLTVNGGQGHDLIDASTLSAGRVGLTLNGGLGDDTILGSKGDDLIFGGDGTDSARMGAGNDTFVWNPGDDNDSIDGGTGTDTMLFNGANAAEVVNIAANGDRLAFTRNVANVVMDATDLERVEFNALGGADNISVQDLSATDVKEVAINLAGNGGVGDGEIDTVFLYGNAADNNVFVVGNAATGVQVIGLAAQVSLAGAEGGSDTLTIRGEDGNDVINASQLQAGTLRLVLEGGAGDDILIGSAGDDFLFGGEGNDVLIGGGGNDTIDGGNGDDIEIQDFVAGAMTDDRIDLSGRGFSFEWLMAHASDVNGNTVLDLGDYQITLRGVNSADLHQDDFLV